MCEINPSKTAAIIKGGLRSIAASFPGAASFGQAWNEYETHRTGERIQELMDNLRLELADLREKNTLNEEAINQTAEEIPSLIEIAVEKVRREFREEKRRMYATLLSRLANAGNAIAYDEKAAILHEFDALSEADIRVLNAFPETRGVHPSQLPLRQFHLPGNQIEQLGGLITILAKLESRGLVGETSTGSGFDMWSTVGDPTSWENRWERRVLGLLPEGRKLRALLR